MMAWWPVGLLCGIVGVILFVEQRAPLRPVFRWLPVPLWCYTLPMIAIAAGVLPAEHPAYASLIRWLLPFALASMLLGADLPAIMRMGPKVLVAAAAGAVGIVVGAPIAAWIFRQALPAEAWKGIGALAGTWTGGTMNLLAVRSILAAPDAVFTPLIVVDAMIAYSWMALLVAASSVESHLNRWLRATAPVTATDPTLSAHEQGSPQHHPTVTIGAALLCTTLALVLTLGAHICSAKLPISGVVSSATGWVVLLVTTAALGLSLLPFMRQVGRHGNILGTPSLYLVLAATGAQARIGALWSTPVWLALGVVIVLLHGGVLLAVGRLLRIPLGVLATASQANIGGVVSAPLVGAVYHEALVPVGLLLAVAGNALGTYFGLLSASLCHRFLS